MIAEEKYRRRGLAKEAVLMLMRYGECSPPLFVLRRMREVGDREGDASSFLRVSFPLRVVLMLWSMRSSFSARA